MRGGENLNQARGRGQNEEGHTNVTAAICRVTALTLMNERLNSNLAGGSRLQRRLPRSLEDHLLPCEMTNMMKILPEAKDIIVDKRRDDDAKPRKQPCGRPSNLGRDLHEKMVGSAALVSLVLYTNMAGVLH